MFTWYNHICLEIGNKHNIKSYHDLYTCGYPCECACLYKLKPYSVNILILSSILSSIKELVEIKDKISSYFSPNQRRYFLHVYMFI